jgi:hypothetical protein
MQSAHPGISNMDTNREGFISKGDFMKAREYGPHRDQISAKTIKAIETSVSQDALR